MKLPAAIRTIGTTLAFLACASLAVAGGGMSLDESVHAHAAAIAHASANLAPAASPATRAPVCDDAPGCPRPAVHVSSVTSRPAARMDAAPRVPQAPLGDRRPDKGEHGRPAATTLHVHRPATQRSKGSLRNTPATPGMGLLLRMGTGAGRELSQLLDDVTSPVSSMRSGRAPPQRAPTSTLARDPIACAAALRPPVVTPAFAPQGVANPTENPSTFRSVDHPNGWESALVAPAMARRTGFSREFTPERPSRLHAVRLKGATA